MRIIQAFLAIGTLVIVGFGIAFFSAERSEGEQNVTAEVNRHVVPNADADAASGSIDYNEAEELAEALPYEPVAHSGEYWLSTDGGNVRAGPGIEFPVIEEVEPLVKLTAFERAKVGGSVWYHVTFDIYKSGWIASSIVEPAPDVLDVPLIYQHPELPTGCEVTSLAMALQYYGIDVDKITLENEMIYDDVPIIRASDRTILQWGDPEVGFVGDPYTLGITINPNPLKQLADQYRPSIALYGEPFDVIEQYISAGKPTIVWFTLHYELPTDRTWLTDEQKEVFAPFPLHTVTVTGVDEQYVYFNDSDANEKHVKLEKEQFIQVYDAMGRRALVIE